MSSVLILKYLFVSILYQKSARGDIEFANNYNKLFKFIKVTNFRTSRTICTTQKWNNSNYVYVLKKGNLITIYIKIVIVFCYQSVNVISFSQSQSDHIKQVPLYQSKCQFRQTQSQPPHFLILAKCLLQSRVGELQFQEVIPRSKKDVRSYTVYCKYNRQRLMGSL